MTKYFEKEELGLYPENANITLAMDGLENSNLFMTTFQGSTDVNFQINYAFNNDAYLYVFGDKLSISRISGLGFPKKACGEEAGMNSTPKEFIKFYKKHKLGQSDTPLRITIGGMTLSGFFVNMAIRLVAGKQNTYTFDFSFLARVH